MRSIAKILGDNISKYREKQGLTQEQLARAVGTTRLTINRIEKGKQWPQIETLEKIASHLLLESKALFKETSKDPIQWALDDIAEELRINEALRAQWIVKRDTLKATRHELVAKLADKEIEQTEKAIEAAEKQIASRRRMIKELESQRLPAAPTTNIPPDIRQLLAKAPKSVNWEPVKLAIESVIKVAREGEREEEHG